jgi:flavodoxin
MKTLVVYYSRSGVTRKVAQAVALDLDAEIEELIDTKDRGGPIGFAVAAKDAALKKLVPIAPTKTNPADFDLVVLGTPVWANTMSSAMRSYLTECGKDIRRAGFFCTTHSSGIESTIFDMKYLAAGETVATVGFCQKAVKRDEHTTALAEFVAKLRDASA